MSKVNIDADLVDKEVTLNRADEKLVEMSNGCICCTQPPQARALLVSRPFLTA
jgi:G3E family GTPase